MINKKDNILHTLENLKDFASARFDSSLSLTDSEKNTLLQKIQTEPSRNVRSQPSPFVTVFGSFARKNMQYALYVLPIVLVAVFAANSETLLTEFNNTKGQIETTQSSIEAKMSLSKAEREIYALKLATDNEAKKKALVSQVVNHAQEVRTKVAALTEENKISEAKSIVLNLEAALKADQLYVVAPEVAEEVFAATDMRVKLEKKEVVSLAFGPDGNETAPQVTPEELRVRIDAIRKEVSSVVAKTSGVSYLVAEISIKLEKVNEYIVSKEIERAIIVLQAAERALADLRVSLVE